MDEPLSNLDARLRADMRVELKALIRRLGVTTIYVTHDQREALSMADRVAVMKDGHIAQCASPRALYESPDSEFVMSFVGETNTFEGEVGEASDAGYEIKSPLGALRAGPGAGQAAAGDAVRVLVRPEDVTIGSALEGDNILTGKIVDVSYAGGTEEVVIELPRSIRMQTVRALRGADPLELGDPIEVAFDADRVKVFKVAE
jgi:ABC-type Fe3+/spermidine/putrescine transport system ATPase subunit